VTHSHVVGEPKYIYSPHVAPLDVQNQGCIGQVLRFVLWMKVVFGIGLYGATTEVFDDTAGDRRVYMLHSVWTQISQTGRKKRQNWEVEMIYSFPRVRESNRWGEGSGGFYGALNYKGAKGGSKGGHDLDPVHNGVNYIITSSLSRFCLSMFGISY